MQVREFLQTEKALYLAMGLTLVFIFWLGSLSGSYPSGAQERMVPLEIASNAGTYNRILAGWLGDPPDADGLRTLASSFRIDFGFIVAYVLLLIAGLGNTRRGLPGWAIGLPVLVGVFDVLENLFHLRLLSLVTGGAPLPAVYPAVVLAAAAVSSHIKWVLFVASTVTILVFFVRNFRELRVRVRIALGVVLLGLLGFCGVYLGAVLG